MSPAEQEIRAAEAALYRAQIAKDLAALDRLLSPDLVYVHSTAVAESKRAYLDGIAQGLYEYAGIDSRDVRVRVGGDVAVTTGICDMVVGETGQRKQLTHLLFVLVWIRQAGAWRLAYRQATRMPAI